MLSAHMMLVGCLYKADPWKEFLLPIKLSTLFVWDQLQNSALAAFEKRITMAWLKSDNRTIHAVKWQKRLPLQNRNCRIGFLLNHYLARKPNMSTQL